MKSSNSVHKVVIVGAGFGGLRAVKTLAHAPVHVTLIDRNNYHLFQPLLYQVATAGITPEEIAYPVRTIFRRQKNFTFRLTEVTGFNLEDHSLETSSGPVRYDTLILAPGGQTNTFGIESVGAHSLGMKDLRDATGVRNHLLRQFESASQETDSDRRRAMLTFVIAGGGPTGVETAGAIMELIQMALKHDRLGIRSGDIRVILMEGTDQLLAGMPADLGEAARRMLASKGVAVRFNALITGYDAERVRLKSGEILPAGTLIWAAGVRAVHLMSRLNVPLSRLGQAIVGPDLRIPGHPDVYVIGDAAAPPAPDGKPLPMVAPVAIQQAEQTAANIQRALRGEALRPFVYRDPGMLATIGRSQAVARVGGIHITGFLAWLAWLGLHIVQLIGFRNRLLVLINWAWDYLFYDRAVRLILPSDPTPAAQPVEQERQRSAEYL